MSAEAPKSPEIQKLEHAKTFYASLGDVALAEARSNAFSDALAAHASPETARNRFLDNIPLQAGRPTKLEIKTDEQLKKEFGDTGGMELREDGKLHPRYAPKTAGLETTGTITIKGPDGEDMQWKTGISKSGRRIGEAIEGRKRARGEMSDLSPVEIMKFDSEAGNVDLPHISTGLKFRTRSKGQESRLQAVNEAAAEVSRAESALERAKGNREEVGLIERKRHEKEHEKHKKRHGHESHGHSYATPTIERKSVAIKVAKKELKKAEKTLAKLVKTPQKQVNRSIKKQLRYEKWREGIYAKHRKKQQKSDSK